ncbi:hypothetical protein LTR04_006097 [Oleoguttula sp. CCFEE 6159]|nr:hypothetical protein LTR04_006097 [Oleoguttula sp. CCFEE 6159]
MVSKKFAVATAAIAKPATAAPKRKAVSSAQKPSSKKMKLLTAEDNSVTAVDIYHDTESNVATTVLAEGPYAGCQAIILKAAKPFPFQRLPQELRHMIFRLVIEPDEGVVQLDGKRATRKSVFASAYGSKFRLSVLSISKEVSWDNPSRKSNNPTDYDCFHQIRDEALPILNDLKFSFDSTTTLLTFLAQIGDDMRSRLRNIRVKTYAKASSSNALHFLADSKDLQKLHFETGVSSDATPEKAAKAFRAEAYRFLEAIGAAKGDKDAGVDILSFGARCFTVKENASARPWTATEHEEFRDLLKEKLK